MGQEVINQIITTELQKMAIKYPLLKFAENIEDPLILELMVNVAESYAGQFKQRKVKK